MIENGTRRSWEGGAEAGGEVRDVDREGGKDPSGGDISMRENNTQRSWQGYEPTGGEVGDVDWEGKKEGSKRGKRRIHAQQICQGDAAAGS